MTKSFWSCAVMTLLSAGVSAGFSLVGLFDRGTGDNFARYAASRSVALLLAVGIPICVRSTIALAGLGNGMTGVEGVDWVLRGPPHHPSPTYQPFALCLLHHP